MAFTLDTEIAALINREGGYVNDPNDSGGETNFGITAFVARANGYFGDMKDMPRDRAVVIYRNRYWIGPRFNEVSDIMRGVAAEMFDTGVNMGTAVAAKFLQRCLNAFNRRGTAWPDVEADGAIGNLTLNALRMFRGDRPDAEVVMVRALNCLQGARYIELAEGSAKNEDFVFGWLKNRVS